MYSKSLKGAALSVLLLATGLGSQVALADAAADLMIESPYARAVPPMQPNSAAFLGLHNMSGTDHAVVSASSPAAESVELHTHSMVDGMMQMRPIDKIDVPSGKMVTLKPGGLHVMLIGLKAPLNEGDNIQLTLTFEDGSSRQMLTAVKSVTAPAMGHGEHRAHGEMH